MKPKPLDKKDVILEMNQFVAFLESRIQDEQKRDEILTAVEELVKTLKQRIKSACDFFLRYKGNPSLLIMERPELKEEVENMFLDRYSTAKYGVNVWRLEQYNEWLFKLAFNFGGDEK